MSSQKRRIEETCRIFTSTGNPSLTENGKFSGVGTGKVDGEKKNGKDPTSHTHLSPYKFLFFAHFNYFSRKGKQTAVTNITNILDYA